MNRLTNDQLLAIAILFVIYSVFITLSFGIHKQNKPIDVPAYELGKRIGARAKTEFLIETNQLKAPAEINLIRIKAIEDSLELNYRK